MSNYCDSVKILLENSDDQFLQASDILIRFCNNVINHPTVPKYRRLRVANPIIEKKLLSVSGGMECLFDLGFEEDGEHLNLPESTPLIQLRKIRDDLVRERKKIENRSAEKPSLSPASQATPSGPTPLRQPTQDILRKEHAFFTKLETSFEHVMVYEDPVLQQKARDVMPVSSFEKEADDKYQLLVARNAAGIDKRDLILLAMMNWFKNSFFSWVNSPACDRCGSATKQYGNAQPLPEELRWGGNRVETYRCESCSNLVKFVRYNHPEKLLETRRGRCGEWANCFTLCCRSLGFEARYVLDWTDHVWTEVYNDQERRWIHFDPCENICDKPLLYESGWGKKLTYIIGFSKDDIQDVTWRYSTKREELKQRRVDCREDWLISRIVMLRNRRLSGLSDSQKKLLQDRCIRELIELMTPPSETTQQLPGRLSGSVAWRLARGEIGTTAEQSYVFQLSQAEKDNKLFHMKYNCATDKYLVIPSNRVIEQWQKGVFKTDSVIRKEELDWNMVYLARAEGSNSAEISWKFDFQDVSIEKVEIYPGSCTYENGQISWSLCSGDQCVLLKGSEQNIVTELKGHYSMVLTARLSGGKGGVAWQHTQLFRQSTTSTETYPLDVRVILSG